MRGGPPEKLDVAPKPLGLVRLARRLLRTLDSKTRRGLYLAAPVSAALALFEAVGFALIFPFLQVLTDTNALHSNGIFRRLYDLTGAAGRDQFLLVVGLAIFGILLFK